jgi:hypothetical protein
VRGGTWHTEERSDYRVETLRTTADAFRDLSIIRETPEGPLRKHQITVDDDLEDTVCALHETRRGAKLLIQFGRQPGGPWLVVSNNAIFDRYVHHPSTPSHGILSDLSDADPTDRPILDPGNSILELPTNPLTNPSTSEDLVASSIEHRVSSIQFR